MRQPGEDAKGSVKRQKKQDDWLKLWQGAASGHDENVFSSSVYRTWHDACLISGRREDGWGCMEQVSCELRCMGSWGWGSCVLCGSGNPE